VHPLVVPSVPAAFHCALLLHLQEAWREDHRRTEGGTTRRSGKGTYAAADYRRGYGTCCNACGHAIYVTVELNRFAVVV
jgi:hypothetical protein